MSIEKHFCSHEQINELKKIGLKLETSINCYTNKTTYYLVVLKSQAFEFFRERYNSHHEIARHANDKPTKYFVDIYFNNNEKDTKCLNTWEECDNYAIDKLIELAKEKKEVI